MEHVVSDLLLERIDRYSKEDPHGDPIPSGGLIRAGRDIDGGSLQTHVTVARISTKIGIS